MKEIMGIRVFDLEDLIIINDDGYDSDSLEYCIVNIYPFDHDMMYLVPCVENVACCIEYFNGEYITARSGIFIHIDDMKRFMNISRIEKAEFYAKAIGDEKLEGFGVLVGYGDGTTEIMLVNKFMGQEDAFWYEYDRFKFIKMGFDDVEVLIRSSTIRNDEEISLEEFFGK